MPELLYEQESYAIRGACIEVYKLKSNGFLESVYHECLALEMSAQAIPFQVKPRIDLEYKGQPLSVSYEPDFLCFSKVIVEIKALHSLADVHRAQVHNYLKATRLRLGFLVNFGHHPGLEIERIVH